MRLFFIFTVLFYIISALAGQKKKSVDFPLKSEQSLNIYSKHWFGKLPLKEANKPLLVHDIFIILFDLEKKFPVWAAYNLSPALVWGGLREKRKYVSDPLLFSSQALSFQDYKGASNCDGKKLGYDKGHLVPLGSFKASPFAYQAQYLSNIVPQTRNLNQGPWRKLEENIRNFVKSGNEVRILTGPLYGKEGKNKVPPCWKAAQGKLQEIPQAYWKLVAFQDKSKIKVCSFLMPQDIGYKNEHPKKYIVKLKRVKKRTNLDIFSKVKRPVVSDCQFLF